MITDSGSGVWEPGKYIKRSDEENEQRAKKKIPDDLRVKVGDKLTVSMWPDATFEVKITPKKKIKGRNLFGGRKKLANGNRATPDTNARMYALVGVHGMVKTIKLCAKP